MPIVASTTIVHTLQQITITANPIGGEVVFSKQIDGVDSGTVTFKVPQAAMASFLAATPSGGISRGTDLTNAVCNYCIAQKLINGALQ